VCKGFEEGSGSLPHQIAEQTLGRRGDARWRAPSRVLPVAQEVARGLPCALTLASRDAAFARRGGRPGPARPGACRGVLQRRPVGVEIGRGRVKNVMAIAAAGIFGTWVSGSGTAQRGAPR